MTKVFRSNGKLLLSAEYFVLDGALALALPVKFGQSLELEEIQTPGKEPVIQWTSLDEKKKPWFSATFHQANFEIHETTDASIAIQLQSILATAKDINPAFLQTSIATLKEFKVKTTLNFPRQWGLGTSSTLIYLIAQWAQVDPFQLQFRTLGGSGYDIACAMADGPIIYQLENLTPSVRPVVFDPPFAEQLYFVYLGRKQNSREGIARYHAKGTRQVESISAISSITERLLVANSLTEFEELIEEHERIVGAALGLKPVQDLLFAGYSGKVKSLGAWGGDFVLVTSVKPESETQRYFNEKGFKVFLPFREMIL